MENIVIMESGFAIDGEVKYKILKGEGDKNLF